MSSLSVTKLVISEYGIPQNSEKVRDGLEKTLKGNS